MTLRVINLIGAPGSGKSTTRSGLFHLMKLAGLSVEETTEYAKDCTWEQNHTALSDQLYIFAKQNHRLRRLQNQVQWAITDSPLILSLYYAENCPNSLYDLISDTWESYSNYNFYIIRSKPYATTGRCQSESQARSIDRDLGIILADRGVPYQSIIGDARAPQQILDLIQAVPDADYFV